MTLKEINSNEESTAGGKALYIGLPHDAHLPINTIATHFYIASRNSMRVLSESAMEYNRLTSVLLERRSIPNSLRMSDVGLRA